MSLGENVCWLRIRRGLSQTALAALIYVRRRHPTPSYISRIESGTIDPRLSTVRSLAKALHVRPWVLVADLSDSVEFWQGYLALPAAEKRDVQRHIEWKLRGSR